MPLFFQLHASHAYGVFFVCFFYLTLQSSSQVFLYPFPNTLLQTFLVPTCLHLLTKHQLIQPLSPYSFQHVVYQEHITDPGSYVMANFVELAPLQQWIHGNLPSALQRGHLRVMLFQRYKSTQACNKILTAGQLLSWK